MLMEGGKVWGGATDKLRLPSVFPIPDVAAHFKPSSEQDIIDAMGSVEWRLGSGMLYSILIKGESEGDPGTVAPFVPNYAQEDLLTSLHNRTVILKARQLGCTTAIALCYTPLRQRRGGCADARCAGPRSCLFCARG